MKKFFLLLAVLLAFGISQAQVAFPRMEIPYNVNYHWGLIDVMIARGNVTAQCDGTRFYGTLDGTSIPWEGKIICVSDTLCADFYGAPNDFRENVVYQSGWYRHPSVASFRSSCYNPDDPSIFKNIAGQGQYDASSSSMEAITVTSDMLAMYYLSHCIDFEAMRPGDSISIPIYGGYSRSVVINYEGEGLYTVNGDNYPCYVCSFEYSYGNSLSGYPVLCKIGRSARFPLYLKASLPVGSVEMLYDPQ